MYREGNKMDDKKFAITDALMKLQSARMYFKLILDVELNINDTIMKQGLGELDKAVKILKEERNNDNQKV